PGSVQLLKTMSARYTSGLGRRERRVELGATVAIELPLRAHLADHFEIEIGDDDLVFVARGFGEDASARVAEVRLAVELADVPRGLVADPVVRSDEVAVGHGVCGLLELPEIFGVAGGGGRGDEDDLGAGDAEGACALREMAVVADVDAHLGVAGL